MRDCQTPAMSLGRRSAVETEVNREVIERRVEILQVTRLCENLGAVAVPLNYGEDRAGPEEAAKATETDSGSEAAGNIPPLRG